MNAHARDPIALIKAIAAKTEHRPAMRLIMKELCEELAMGVRDVTGDSRYKHIVRARWEFMRRAKDAGYKQIEIARFLSLDHTTVAHGLEQWAKELEARG